MRVAHVITRMIIGGAQENTLYNCVDLQRIHGDDVLLITGPAIGPEGDLLQQGRADDLEVALLPDLRRAIHPLRDWKALAAIKQALRRFRPDVVHTHSAKGGILGRQAAHSLNVPAIIHTVHGAPFHNYQPWITRAVYRACEKRAAKQCHRLVSVADAMTDMLVDAGVAPREKFIKVFSGMDVQPFLDANDHREQTRRELGIAEHEIVIGKIARLFHLKGHEDVVRAASKVAQAQPNVKFLFVGDGVLRESLVQKIEAAGLTKHFCFTGLVPPEQIPRFIGVMDLLVHASYREGLARALPQALISGKPVVSYDIDGAREVAINDETGYLVEAGDIEDLGKRMTQLAADAKLRGRLAEQGRARFTKPFRHETMTAHLRQIYADVLASNR